MKKYIVFKNGCAVYMGGKKTATNRYNHLVTEDWKDEDVIILYDDKGEIVDIHGDEL